MQLGWKPQYSTDEMLAESYDWFVSHRAETDRADDVSHHRRTALSGILQQVKRLTKALPARGDRR